MQEESKGGNPGRVQAPEAPVEQAESPQPPTSDEEAKDDTSVSSFSIVSASSLQCEDIAEDTVLIGCGEQRTCSTLDADWSISFEQILASILTETPLVDFFEKRKDIRIKIADCKGQRTIERQATDAGSGLSRWTKFLENSRGEPAVEEGLVDEEENVYTDKDHFCTEKRDKKDLTSSKENAGKSMILGQPLPPPKATANKKTSLGLKDSTIPEYCTNNSTGMTASKWERFLPSTTREDESGFSPQSEKDLQHSQTFTTPLAFCSALDMPSQLEGTGSLTLVDKALQRKRSKLTAEGGLPNRFPPTCTQPTSSFVSPIVSAQALTADPLQPSFCSLFQTDEDFDETF
ncbi:UNVERIFIED_CONTAM: hypothetical protein FKN15_017114 [Acipenser sinensis]